MAREILEKTDSGESIISFDVKSLYTNVLLKEAVETDLRKIYGQIDPPEIIRKL